MKVMLHLIFRNSPPTRMKMWKGFIVSSSDPPGSKNSFKVTGAEGKPGTQFAHMCGFKTISFRSGSPSEALMP